MADNISAVAALFLDIKADKTKNGFSSLIDYTWAARFGLYNTPGGNLAGGLGTRVGGAA